MTETRSLKTFIDKDLKVFSNLDNVRSIPSLIDGFKDSQRKAIFGMIKHGPSEIKIAQAAGYCSMVTQYAHGEGSMGDTLVGLAQNFTGSNNVNLLEPIGQFGSILSSESSAHRYIFTKHSENLRKYLRREDDLILEHREEEGEQLEPINYLPIVPMWIVNGAVGIGTGHSVRILSRDPKKVSSLIQRLVDGVNVQQRTIDDAMTPYFHGWKGKVVKGDSDTQWELFGVIEKVNTTTLKITELPVTYDMDKYKSILIGLMDKGIVKDYDNLSTEEGFEFIVNVPREVGRKDIDELIRIFKLSTRVGEVVTLWGVDGLLKRYDSVYDALLEFVQYRLSKYGVRKQALLEVLDNDLEWLESKIKFITYWNTKLKDPHKKGRAELEKEFESVVPAKYIDRLLAMQISSLTMDQIEDLKRSIEKTQKERQELLNKTEKDMYREELASL